MVRVSWPSSGKEGQELPLRPKNDPEVPVVEIYPFDSNDGLIVKVQPPKDHPNPTLHHVPCDIVLVIDVSGSMTADAPVPGDGGERMGLSVLDLTKHAARTILETLGPQDRLGIVTFASEAQVSPAHNKKTRAVTDIASQTLQKLVPMTQTNKRKAKQNIESMTPQDCTNLWHGILSGIKLFEGESSASGRVPAIMVLTDGMPNHMCPAQGYVPKLRSMGRLPAAIHTFGFGYDLRSGLLKSIAEVSGGNYAFIPDAGMIGTVFVHAVANLQSTFADAVTLKLTYPPYLQLEETTGESVDQQKPTQVGRGKNSHSQLTLSFGTLQFGHSRDIYLRYANTQELADFLAMNEAGLQPDLPPVVNAVLEYSCLDGNIYKAVCHRSIVDTGEPKLSLAEKAYHISRSAIVELLSRVAPIRAKDGEHVPARSDARKLAVEVEMLLSSLPAADPRVRSDPRCASLLEDLTGEDPKGQISLAFKKKFFGRWGIHYLPSLANAHAKQICNSFKDPGPLMYGTESPLFERCRDRLDNIFDSLPAPKPSNHTTYRSMISMSSWNSSCAPCFAGNATVVVVSASGEETRVTKVGRLRGGIRVLTPLGPRKVVAVLKTRVRREAMCLVGKGLMITPWHPLSLDGKSWNFPARISHRPVRYTGSIYSVLLERDADVDAHAVMVGGVWGVTLGHGLVEAGGEVVSDVRAHHFLGDYDAVLRGLSGLHKGANGLVVGGGLVRDKRTGLVNGFKRVAVPASRI